MLQPIADKVAQNLENISKKNQFSTRRIRILMGFFIYYLVLIENPLGSIVVCYKSLKNNLEILCHPICNRIYFFVNVYPLTSLYDLFLFKIINIVVCSYYHCVSVFLVSLFLVCVF